MEVNEVLTIEQAAARLGVSSSTIWRRIKCRALSTERVLGRVVVRATAIDALEPLGYSGGRRRKVSSNNQEAGEKNGGS